MEYRIIDISMLNKMAQLFIESFNCEPWLESWTEETAVKRLEHRIKSETSYGICAYINDNLFGFILGNFEQFCDRMEFVIQELAVRNSMRGQKIGSKLITEFEKRLRNKGVENITLLTIKGNMTEHFYQKNGFNSKEKIVFMNKKL